MSQRIKSPIDSKGKIFRVFDGLKWDIAMVWNRGPDNGEYLEWYFYTGAGWFMHNWQAEILTHEWEEIPNK